MGSEVKDEIKSERKRDIEYEIRNQKSEPSVLRESLLKVKMLQEKEIYGTWSISGSNSNRNNWLINSNSEMKN